MSTNESGVTFEMNGLAYETDADTLEMLRSIVPPAKASRDFSAVIAAMHLGEATGRIRLIGRATKDRRSSLRQPKQFTDAEIESSETEQPPVQEAR